MSVQRRIACELAAARVGERTTVLVEEAGGRGRDAVGRSPREAPDVDPVIFVRGGGRLRPGDMAEVEITGSARYDCVARALLR
jgi:ribosomal protein S12 methylthiotransferase